jgi:NADH:ubiquinone oxidoreductase subunit K
MDEDENFTRFFCFLSLFAASMLGLVISNNLLLLFMCWELVGLCSYLLIGFWYFKPSAAAAMKKAFITTRIGDVGFFLGILMLYWKTGTLNLYATDGTGALQQAGSLAHLAGWWGLSAASTIAFLLFIGAMGKSAQFPLHVWLPDAMEGPTPVSALIHAGTGRLGDGLCDVDWLFHGGLFRDDCGGAVRHQTRTRLFNLLATRVHGDGAGRRQSRGGTIPFTHSCLLQGAAIPRLGLRDYRHAS